jgi:PTH1 family peptidyl-tRNA hydrolase
LKIVLGLGNPGEAYRSTRHNMGFWVLDRVARRRGLAFRKAGLLRRYAWVAETDSVLLAKPRTFMNRSGRAAAALCRAYDAEPREMLVVYDDADLELGRLRLRKSGGAGGHNGMRSLIEVLGTEEFPRVRLGVRGEGRDERDLADYVLEDFHNSELPVAEVLADLGADAVEEVIETGLEAAMNRYNARRAGPVDLEDGEEDSGRASRGPA